MYFINEDKLQPKQVWVGLVLLQTVPIHMVFHPINLDNKQDRKETTRYKVLFLSG